LVKKGAITIFKKKHFMEFILKLNRIQRLNKHNVECFVHLYSYLCISDYFKLKNLKTMKKNMGSVDKIIRFVLAALFVILYFTNVVTGTVGIILLVLAGVFVLTSFISFCPLYAPFGLSTCKRKVG
jgi:fatty acid desaturase